ncbi:MAG: hypothetical protein WD426_01440 [Anditalea sp.]
MKTSKIINDLKNANFSLEQANKIAEILENQEEEEKIRREQLDRDINSMLSDIDKYSSRMTTAFEVGSEMKNELDVINKGFVDFKFRFDVFDNKFEIINSKFDQVDIKSGSLKSDLQNEISKSKYDLLKWIIGLFIANGAFMALLKYLG